MKTTITTLLTLALALACPIRSEAGGMPVVDAAHIASNRVSHAVDYVQQVLHEANQQTQIGKQIEQIKQLYEQIDQLYQQIEQIDDYLERFGDPKAILDLAGFDQLLGELKQVTGGLNIEDKLPDLSGEDFFGFTGDGIFQPIREEFEIGEETFDRDPERYTPHEAARVTIEQYREKKTEVLERRDALRGEIAQTAEQLQSAETDSEVKKLSGVLLAQQTELQAIDRELDIARGDAEARVIENENQAQAEAKARAEESARRFEAGNRADVQTYRLDRSGYGW